MEWIYIKNRDNSSRFALGIAGNNPLICFGINPSTAAPGLLDNTLKSVERQAKLKGFDSWLMLNIYPQRATYPKDIHTIPDFSLHQKNLKTILKLLKKYENPTIWAAWGTLIESRDYFSAYLFDIFKICENKEAKWIQIGKCSKKGHPHHPLYLASTAAVELFSPSDYIKNLK